MKRTLLFIGLLIFIAIKLSSLGIRGSDTNTYFYEAHLLLQGKVLYKDFFFSNFPFFAYIASLYYMLVGKNLTLFYFTTAIEVVVTTVLIYEILKEKYKEHTVVLTATLLYPFSFLVLATSDHQTGVTSASLLAVISYFFWQKKHLFISGAFLSLCILTKAYFLPVAVAFFFSLLTVDTKKKMLFLSGFAATTLLVMLPTLFTAPKEFVNNVFGFSLTRPQGIAKANIIRFFLTHDTPFVILLLMNIFLVRQYPFFGILSVSTLLFFFFYKDTYYLYLSFLAPFLSLSLAPIMFFLRDRIRISTLFVFFLVAVALVINVVVYLSSYQALGRFYNIDEIVAVIKREKPAYLYGVSDITPALLLLTNTKPLANVFDAHPAFFRRNVFNKDELTKRAIAEKAIVVTHGFEYPPLNISEPIIDEIINKDMLKKSCSLLASYPVKSEGIANYLNLFACYERTNK